MKISIEGEGRIVSYELSKDAVTCTDAISAYAMLLVCFGYARDNIDELFKDGFPGDWDDFWDE